MKYLIILMSLLVTACASTPKGAMTFDEVKIPGPYNGESTLVFYRKISPPAAYEMRVNVNDKEAVSLPNNAFSYVSLKPGSVKIKISWSAWSGMPSREKNVEVPPNSIVYLELTSSVYTPGGVQLGSDSTLTQSDSYAINILRSCCKYVPSKF